MESRNDVSVVIPTLNAGAFLGRALESVRRQGPWVGEILVVDGGSTDDSVRIAQAAGARILGGRGTSLIDAWNLGITEARRPWIAFLDADDEWTPNALASHFDAVASAEIGTSSDSPCVSGSTGRVRFRLEQVERPLGFREELLGESPIGWMPGSTLIRAVTASELGEFSHELELASDLDWFDRLRTRARVVVNEEVVLLKSVRPDSASMAGSRPEAQRSAFSDAVLRLARQRAVREPDGVDEAQ
jgi:glycosyltransferase involved in cell wall biosynthesis